MLSLFAIPKPFRGHIETIQRNAIQSWTLLHPRPDIILFGGDEGTAEVADEFGVRHVPHVARNEYGTPLVSSLFEVAQGVSKAAFTAYVNADIILLSDFMDAVSRVSLKRFVICGQRWDLDLDEAVDFMVVDWEDRFRTRVREAGRLHARTAIDYFVFPHGLYRELPPFTIGRTVWDNWLIYRAWSLGVPVIDATDAITAVHQNHDYSHNKEGRDGIWKGPEARQNLELAGGLRHVFTLEDAKWLLTAQGMKRPKLTRERLHRRLDILGVLRPGLDPWAMRVRLLMTPWSLVRDLVARGG